MSRLLLLLLLCVSTVFIASCAQTEKVEQPGSPAKFNHCPDERPQICTREYRPVCATRDTGVRCVTAPCPSSEYKTYGNACTACADEKVSGYVPDSCVAESKNR